MATTDYWDYWRTNCGTGSTATNARANYDTSTSGTSWTSSTWHYIEVITRKILVSAPPNWSEEQNMKFVELVNIKTKTGWIVTLVIKNGDILITDPKVERRTMAEFSPLLKNDASESDLKLINEFFESNPV